MRSCYRGFGQAPPLPAQGSACPAGLTLRSKGNLFREHRGPWHALALSFCVRLLFVKKNARNVSCLVSKSRRSRSKRLQARLGPQLSADQLAYVAQPLPAQEKYGTACPEAIQLVPKYSRVPWAFLCLDKAKNYPMLLLGTLDAERQLAPLVQFLPGGPEFPHYLDLRKNRMIRYLQSSRVLPEIPKSARAVLATHYLA